ncbi:hypothetical protein C9J27_04645 [Photobacterium kishitanii]|uniref:Uncharacterized protein n=1 Tax=Photobacterium kishitanii TaxID=318456 RepID=A0A2T3KL91_9GAMM|nr:hypothetical protein C9J27_04645 [Photobacterium kishitanii]
MNSSLVIAAIIYYFFTGFLYLYMVDKKLKFSILCAYLKPLFVLSLPMLILFKGTNTVVKKVIDNMVRESVKQSESIKSI